jgi:hypothetical protein
MDTKQPPRSWNVGYLLLLVVPFIGLVITVIELPLWVEIPGLLVVVALVGTGASLMRRPDGGWRPSQTLPRGDDDGGRR